MNVNLLGEFRCVVTKNNGKIKFDSGYQRNLITDAGLNFLGTDFQERIGEKCVVGGGSTPPLVSQTALTNFIAASNMSVEAGSDYSYDSVRDGGFYRPSYIRKYSFTGLVNKNLSEIGLANRYGGPTSNILSTRALIKDSAGSPTSITVLEGEQLDVYYKITMVMAVADTVGSILLDNGEGGSVEYNYTVRPSYVGSVSYVNRIGMPFMGEQNSSQITIASGEIGSIAGTLLSPIFMNGQYDRTRIVLKPYVTDSFKRGFSFALALDEANGDNRSISLNTSFGLYQIRYGKVGDDTPIVKTASHKMSYAFEASWGRYEGEL